MKAKRLVFAVLMGGICGCVSIGVVSGIFGEISYVTIVRVMSLGLLLGFIIGISRLSQIHWMVHGLFIGLLFSIPEALRVLELPLFLNIDRLDLAILVIASYVFYGFFIEGVTSVIFKARIKELFKG